MITRLYSAALDGISGYQVQVEVDGFYVKDAGRISIVGLPDAAVKESIQRVTAAIFNSELYRPESMVCTVNLAPADVKKQGPGFDLAIALGLEIATQLNHHDIPKPARRDTPEDLQDWCIIGELALDGTVRGVRGILSLAIAARDAGHPYLMLSPDNAAEAAVVKGIDIYPVNNLLEAWDTLFHRAMLRPYELPESTEETNFPIDFDEVKGQPYARRALEIAAAGGHNMLMCGSPGSGKSMLASRLPTILPPMQQQEALEASQIHSVCGLLPRAAGLLSMRPYRSPHHTISDVGLMGGGSTISPGEISLAHHGVLFMDELPEFHRRTLETLRQPLESGRITISRASGTVDYPCSFMLIAAMNPCPCGYYGDPIHRCRCSHADIVRYRKKISGPLLDRFDMLIEIPALPPSDLLNKAEGEGSKAIRNRVIQARALQQARYEGTATTCNARLSSKQLKQYCPLSEAQKELLLTAAEQFGLSARAFDRILRVARTIADLAGREQFTDTDLCEAIQFRSFETQLRN